MTNGTVSMSNSQNPLVRLPGVPATARADAARADVPALKDAVRNVLGLDAGHTIVIQEFACAEPGCPPVETVIGVLSGGKPARRWILYQPLSSLTAGAIRAALTENGHR
jgi:hypothetical protein